MIIHTMRDLAYVPKPNISQLIRSPHTSPVHLTTATFVFCFDETGIWLARNNKRGLEIPGGHVEPGETLKQAAIREILEELGIVIINLRPFIYQKIETMHEPIEGYKYPYPVSYMQFWTGTVQDVHDYIDNDECSQPVHIGIQNGNLIFSSEKIRKDFYRAQEKSQIFALLMNLAITNFNEKDSQLYIED